MGAKPVWRPGHGLIRDERQNPAYRSTRPSRPCPAPIPVLLSCLDSRLSLVDVGRHWVAFDGPVTAQTAQSQHRGCPGWNATPSALLLAPWTPKDRTRLSQSNGPIIRVTAWSSALPANPAYAGIPELPGSMGCAFRSDQYI
ncbi:hypothetical protein GCM10009835_28500 [Planosporangium flavigriseum]|uniref:Uncharacterized protein n=1 Tax=Planosporangium flavigriseum TaxID=373681 RepID=A0A8J3PN22_9ACTN|nr:hypothetical protein Pfl04_45600 [Planosporangium flavigriseum]